jgi:hypothetical protein
VPVGLKRHLGPAIRGAHPRALDRDAAAAERHRAGLVTMTHGAALGIVLPLRAHDIADLLLHQLGHDTKPDTHA